MKKVLVTGANGYIGRHVVDELVEKGFEVIASDLEFDGVNSKAHRCNTEIFSGSKAIFEETGSPDICIHLAWRDGFVHNSPRHMLDLSKHYEFLANMAEGGCKNISVMGSMHEIGYWEGKVDDSTPCNPLSQYGVAKNALRQSILLLAESLGFNVYWLRAYYILGDDMKNHSIFARILQTAQEGRVEFPFTSGKNKYDFIKIEELSKRIVAASTQDKYTGIIEVCTGNPVALSEQVEQFIKEHHLNISLKYGEFPDRTYDSPVLYGDNTIIDAIMAGALKG